MSKIIDPKLNKRLQDYIKAEDYRTLIYILFKLTIKRIKESFIFNSEIMLEIEENIRKK